MVWIPFDFFNEIVLSVCQLLDMMADGWILNIGYIRIIVEKSVGGQE